MPISRRDIFRSDTVSTVILWEEGDALSLQVLKIIDFLYFITYAYKNESILLL